MDNVTDYDSGAVHETLRLTKRCPAAFLLRLQESVRIRAGTSPAVEMGTSTFTQIQQEAADADNSLSYSAIGREK